jgi:5-methylcytosine-specific restriction endonuclease McrA
VTGCGCGGERCRLPTGDERHGTNHGYCTGGCRCPGCRAASRVAAAKYRVANRAEYNERQGRYNRSDRRRELARAWHRKWNATEAGRAYGRLRSRRRRERERARYCGCDTRENLAAIWALDSGRCAYCNAPGTDYEHVVPLARGGWGCVSNFRVACKSCNSKKGVKPLSVFLDRLAASGVAVRPGATNSGLPCPAAAERMARRALTA